MSVVLAALIAGVLTTLILSGTVGLDTSAWSLGYVITDLALDALVLTGYTAGWALLGTTLGFAVRSVPLALGIGLAWSGPIENIVGDDWEFAQRWFPGLLLRGLLIETSAIEPQVAVTTLASYALVAVAVLTLLAHHDVRA